MIFTDRTIIVQKGTSSINDTIILYRGDKGVEIRFTLNEGSPFRFGSGASPNIIEKTEAAYGQLVIKTPNDLPAIFSEVVPTNEGKIVFTITAEMIDEITEVGNYTFQIRLFDESMNSRASLPEVVDGIEIREPIASEDGTNEVGVATVGYALTTVAANEDAFDAQGNYNKTTWGTGDRITAAKLNKMEAGIDGVNQKVVSNASDISITDTGNYFTSTNVEGALQETGSQIKERAKQSDLEVERKRIDSFTSLAEGSTTGDAELIDARTDDLGVTHANVGEAFRRRAAKLNQNIKIISDNVIGMSINLADISIETMTDGYYISSSNGELLAYTNWSASDFIDIKPNTEYSVVFYLEEQNKYLRQDSVYYAVYDDNGTFIKGSNTGAFASPTTINSGSGSKLKISCINTRVRNAYMMLILTSDESKVLGKDKTAYVECGPVLGGLVRNEFIKTKTELKDYVDVKLSVPKIILPDDFYAVVGHELSIYNENVILCDDINRYSVDWYINQGNFYEQYNECFRITPKSGKEGDYNVICTIRDKYTYSILAQKTMTMHIVSEKTFTNKNVLFIGDSRTSAGYYPYEIQTNLSNNGITSLGTVISNPWIGNIQKPINHEGRGGWSAKDYVTQSSKGGYTNAFLNPDTNKFDFSYYMTQQGYTSVDAVFINLGTNGMKTNNLDGSIDDNISAMDEMITSIRAYSSTVPIIVEVITPPATQDGWTYANHGGSVWEMMFNIFRNNEKVIEHYDGRKSEGIYLAPTIFNLDRNNDYGTTTMPLSARNPKEIVRQTNNVHPRDIGYYKMADVFWCLINALI